MSSVAFSIVGGSLQVWDGASLRWVGKPRGLEVLEIRRVPDADDVLVLLEPGNGWKAVRNIIRFSHLGEVLWEGELPQQSGADCFTTLQISDGDVIANTWSGNRVRLDLDDGHLIESAFTK